MDIDQSELSETWIIRKRPNRPTIQNPIVRAAEEVEAMTEASTPVGPLGAARRTRHDVEAQVRLGRVQHGLVGFFGYLIPGAVAALAVLNVIDALDIEPSRAVRLCIYLVLPVVAAWRGATVALTVRQDAVVVRNRWRTVTVPFGEIERIERGESMLYGPLQVITSIFMNVRGYSAFDTDAATSSDMLFVERRGHRRRLPAYATLGMAFHVEKVRPLIAALEAHGLVVAAP